MWKWLKALNPFESDNYAPWMREEIAALRAELAAAEIELADKAFYVREFAAVSAERDAARADIDNAVKNAMDRLPDAPWKDKTATEAVWLLSLAVGNANAELAELKAQLDETERQLQAEKTERFAAEDELAALKSQPGWELDVTWQDLYNTYQTKLCGLQGSWEAILDLCRSRIRPAAQYGGWHFENGGIVPNGMPECVPLRSVRFDVTPEEACEAVEETVDRMADDDEVYMRSAMDYLAAHAVVLVPQPATPRAYTDADVEKLARVLRAAYMKECHIEPSDCPPSRGYVAEARAAMDWMGAPMGKCKECAEKDASIGGLLGAIRAYEQVARTALEGE